MLSFINIAKATKLGLFLGMMILLISKATPGDSFAISGRSQPVTSIIGSDDDETHDPPPVITSSQLSRVYHAEPASDNTQSSKKEPGEPTRDQMKTEGGSISENPDDLRPVTETRDQSEGQLYPRSATV
uniref:Secreted protein n=1 Tax=Cacopsylla melanoneura TaxID=428564 RepID=A0A8D9A3X3_9HEMI